MIHIRNALPKQHMTSYALKAPAFSHMQSHMLAHAPNLHHGQFDLYHNHFGLHNNYHDTFHNYHDGFGFLY
ncbi:MULTISPECIES: hypothetical protein [unclassified Wolbachia]|uniref:hypothetical protein n=1 Tax=unclassified Wolbachia TaxID=2640676 RepID=UPI0021F8A9C8|nr:MULTISPECIES: hypothetical protein [unclassified Wolbachia]